jgi:hypothetical protein
VERRAPNRPMTGKKRAVPAAAPARAAHGAAAEEWKDF